MIAVLISLIVLGIVAAVFIIQNRHYGEQEQIVQMQEGARFAVQMMTNDLTMAGYDPTGSASVGFVASGTNDTSIRFRSDLDGDGNTTGANEDVTYAFNSGTRQLTRKSTAADTATPMVENINVLTFTYYDADGNTTTNPAEIRKIRIQVTVQNQNGDRTETLATDVQPRNLALKPPPGGPTVAIGG